ncbi:MAG: hypothetical protein LBH25_11285 [Fibromonadaceae bacterium]|jgi:hypothetical protein|nr:hypothetical protein [Fibromonadaceae bacterium]
MKKNEFESKLTIAIAHHRLALLREIGNHNLFYSSEMYDSEEKHKIYLLELHPDDFIIRKDLIFDSDVEKFFYVSKDKYEYSEENLKEVVFIMRQTENKIYDILSKLRLRGFYGKGDFIHRILKLIPQLEWSYNSVRDSKSATTFITVKDDMLCFTYKDGKMGSYMNITRKDFNEKILAQCVEIITTVLKSSHL